MRISAGSVKESRNGGYIHILKSGYSPNSTRIVSETVVYRDFNWLMRQFQTGVNPAKLNKLATKLELTSGTLHRLGIGWDNSRSAWAFPMRDCAGNVRGIRLRRDNGEKFAVNGGHEGLFIPDELPVIDLIRRNNPEPLLITEGPTDCAALLDLGFAAIGRPSCTGGTKLIGEWMQLHRPTHVAIVADDDSPGQRGAESLAIALMPFIPTLRVITPPDGVKDVRDWKRAGATREAIIATIESAPIRRMKMRTRIVGSKGVSRGF